MDTSIADQLALTHESLPSRRMHVWHRSRSGTGRRHLGASSGEHPLQVARSGRSSPHGLLLQDAAIRGQSSSNWSWSLISATSTVSSVLVISRGRGSQDPGKVQFQQVDGRPAGLTPHCCGPAGTARSPSTGWTPRARRGDATGPHGPHALLPAWARWSGRPVRAHPAINASIAEQTDEHR